MAEQKKSISPYSFTTFGELLRYLRTRAELTQRDLAAKVGYHYSHVNRFEKNQRIPDQATLLARFVPALEIEHEQEWVARLVELAQTHSKEDEKPPQATVSIDQIYSVPTSLTSLIGRESETQALTKLLLQAHIRLLTLIGPPGVGKTRTALHLAEKVSKHFFDGAVFVNLMPLVHHEMVLHQLSQSLGIIESGDAPQTRTLQNFLQNKNLLIVLDNFEQVLEAAPQIQTLLTVAPAIKILVTSREALRLQGEYEFPLKPLPIPNQADTISRAEADNFPAIQLFVERATAIQPSFRLDEENASLIAEICRRLDGLPLAIELAAARISTLQPVEMLTQFDRLFEWLTRGKRDLPAWRQTLLGAIEWSYNLLTPEEKTLMARLAVFSSGWTLQAAENICSDEVSLKRNVIFQLLSQLVDRSLVVAESSNGKTRYRYLDTIFHFALSKLKESNGLARISSRHLGYFASWTENMKDALEQESPLELRSGMDAENNNLSTALAWGLQSKAGLEQALRLVYAAGSVWLKHSHFKEALGWVIRYLPLSENHKNVQAQLYYLATALSYWREDLNGAVAYASKGLEIARVVNDLETCASILYYLGDIHRERGEIEKAKNAVEESLKICKAQKYMIRLSMGLTSLSVILYRQKEWAAARKNLSEALDIAVNQKSLWAQSYNLRVQADLLRYEGNFPEAFQAYERALNISSVIDDRISMGMEFANIALAANILDDYQASAYYAEKALHLFQEIGNEYQQPFPQRMIAYALINENNLTEAHAYCMESLKGNRTLGHGHEVGVLACLVCLAKILWIEGNLTSASNLVSSVITEVTSKHILLMEPDQKALEALRRELKITASFDTNKAANISDILAEFGVW